MTSEKSSTDTQHTVASDARLGKSRFDEYFMYMLRSIAFSRDPGLTDVAITARVASRMRILDVPADSHVTSMAMNIVRGRLLLFYNVGWMAKVNYTEWSTTLVHEVYHVVSRDVPEFYRRMAAQPDEQTRHYAHRMLNVAMDAANNQLMLKRNPHMLFNDTGGWVLPKQLGWAEDDVTSAEYWESLWLQRKELLNKVDALKNQPGGIGSFPSNGSSEDKLVWYIADKELTNQHAWTPSAGDSDDPDELRAKAGKIDKMLKGLSFEELEALASEAQAAGDSAIKQALRDYVKAVGNLPSHWAQVLDKLTEVGQISWTDVMRRVVGSQAGGERVRTTTRSSRRTFVTHLRSEDGAIEELRLPLPVRPGNRRDLRHLTIFAIDTSGSMSNADVLEGLAELKKLKTEMPEITIIVMQVDTHVSHICELHQDTSVEEYIKTVGRTSGGGTHFYAPFNVAKYIATNGRDMDHPAPQFKNEVDALMAAYSRVDLVVYHTDGYGSAPSATEVNNIPTLWCLPSNNRRKPAFANGEEFGIIVERK